MTKSYRALNDWERAVVLRLLEPSFAGRDELLKQLEKTVCRPDGSRPDNGGLLFETSSKLSAPVESGVPTEGEALDIDGVPIHYMLHVANGKLVGLQIIKNDDSKVHRHAVPSDLDVTFIKNGVIRGINDSEEWIQMLRSAGKLDNDH